ncbi:amino acid adenylation domain-containing protein, partial [Ascidiimonas sp. W6]|uniref:amino acid adenylation domain-containing protein n=1 Tax=Ascidiimonas meishanensis TaxID=3128903 RepID=UPI0030EE689D
SKTSYQALETIKGIKTLVLDDIHLLTIEKESIDSFGTIATPQTLAYVIYTSGSTGKPKGVMIEHCAIVNRLLWTQSHYQLTAKDVLLQKTPFCFDVSVWELLWSITCGAKLVFAKPEGHKDVEYLKTLITSHKVTTIHFVPSMLRVFLEAIVLGDCTSLQRILCSGEALAIDHILLFKDKFSDVRLDNLYGPTEAAIDVSSWEVPLENTLSHVSIGSPVANTSLYVLDKKKQLVPIGVVGELCISGVQVARGYLNKEELTKQKFIENPFVPGERMYRTGDLAKWLPDGNIQFIGRIDDQVKIRGYRIELREIETALAKIQEVAACCVLAKEDVSGNKRLVAYVVMEDVLDKAFLQSKLKTSLPEYMVPSIWVELEAMPLTTNGKLDKKALPDPDASLLSSQPYVAPRNLTEQTLVNIWKDLLGVEQIGIHDNFFELGGDSIISIRLISKINEVFDRQIQLQNLFNYTTIQRFSDSVLESDIKDDKFKALYESIKYDINTLSDSVLNSVSNPNIIEDIYPMSDIQQGMIMETLSASGSGIYHDQFVFPIKDSSFNIEIFEKAINLLIEKHSIFRTRFNFSDYKEPVQIVYNNVNVNVRYTDLSELFQNPKAQKETIEQYLIAERQIPFDFKEGQPYRFHIFNIDTDNGVFVFQFHHSILDGWSVASFNTELHKIYFELKNNINYLPSPIASNQRDFIIRELIAKQDTNVINFWKETLSGYKYLDIFSEEKQHVEYYTKQYSLSFFKGLQEKCKEYNMSLKTVLFGAYVYALQMLTYETEVIVGLIGNTRPLIKDGDKILGCFLNSLPMRYTVPSDGNWLTYFRDFNEKLEEISLHNQMTFFEIKRLVGIYKNDPVIDTLFNYIDFHIYNEISQENTSGKNLEKDLGISSFERTDVSLNLTVDVTGGESIVFAYTLQKDLKSKVSLERFHSFIYSVLDCFCSKIHTPISNDLIISDIEKQQSLNLFNSTTVAYPKDKTLVDIFQEQVNKTPDNIALVFEEKTLSYLELDKRSNQLARYLIRQGIKTGDLVAISLERSLEMIIGILGILKAGAAYVPIDPGYPELRIKYMIQDAGVDLVVTSKTSYQALETIKGIKTLVLDGIHLKTIKKESIDSFGTIATPQTLAYVIYTSGSTGKPKGVMVEHQNVVQLFKHESCLYDFAATDVWTLFHSFCFDFSVWEIYGALLHGGRLIIVPEKLTKDAVSFRNLLLQEKVTVLNQTPSAFYALQDELLLQDFSISIRYIIFGGEALNPSHLGRWKKRYPNCKLINMYGITETTIHVTYREITSKDIQSTQSIIGRAIPTLSCYILDEYQQLLPIGVIGELCISGAGVARGYLNKEEL